MTTDRLVQQERLYPGQLLPLLRLMGVGAVVSGTDDDLVRSGAVDPASAAATLAGQGLGRPSRSYGPVRTLPAPRGSLAAPQPEPQVRRYDLRTGRGLVHVEPIGPATVVDGGAEGVAALAAFGALPADRPLLYAGDLSADELRREAAGGASVVVSDSNRRRRFLPEFTEQNLGATARGGRPAQRQLGPDRPVPGQGHRRPDRRGAPGGEVRHRARPGRPARVPRAHAVEGLRRRPEHRVGGRPLPPGRGPLDRDRLRRPARRALRRPAADPRSLRHRARGRRQRRSREARPRDHAGAARPARRSAASA